MVIEVIRSRERYVKECLPNLSTRYNGVMPIDHWNCVVTGTEGSLIGRGLSNCASAAIWMYQRSMLTHCEPAFSARCFSQIKEIVRQPAPYAEIVIVYPRGRTETLTKMKEGLCPLFPDAEIGEAAYGTTVDSLIFYIDEKKLFILEQRER